MKYDYSDYREGLCTFDEYYNQFKTPETLEVGKVYKTYRFIVQHWVKIVFIGEGVALGVVIKDDNGNLSVGIKRLYVCNGTARDGFPYDDSRPVYRLIEEATD